MTEPGFTREMHDRITREQNTEDAAGAIATYLSDGDTQSFEYAVALYVSAARQREEPIERILAALNAAGDKAKGLHVGPGKVPSEIHLYQLILSGVLRAFYGEVAVAEEHGAADQRKVDAPQHAGAGTWPRGRHTETLRHNDETYGGNLPSESSDGER